MCIFLWKISLGPGPMNPSDTNRVWIFFHSLRIYCNICTMSLNYLLLLVIVQSYIVFSSSKSQWLLRSFVFTGSKYSQLEYSTSSESCCTGKWKAVPTFSKCHCYVRYMLFIFENSNDNTRCFLLVNLQQFIENKFNADEKLTWAQNHINKGFAGCVLLRN